MGKNFLDDAKTKRSLDALWKLNQGVSYQFEEDSTETYQKTVPSGAKLASIKKIGGKTIVWNQLFNFNTIKTRTYKEITFTNNGDGTYTVNGTATEESFISSAIAFTKGHMYYMQSLTTIAHRSTYEAYITGNNIFNDMTDVGYGSIDTATNTATGYFVPLYVEKGVTVENLKIIPQIYDLTKMFGAGNEPSTPEEFEAMFQADYYPYNEGTLMSIPVNEVVEHGKNYFDFSKLVSDGVNVMDYEKQTITVPAKTNNTGYNQTLRDLCPGITPGTYVLSMKRSNPESGTGSYFLEAMKDFQMDTLIELTDELLDNHIAWYNNPDSDVENVISEIQIEKNSTKTSYSQYYQKSHKIPQAILDLDGYGESGNFVDFVEKKYHKLDRTIDISDIIGNTFQEPFEVEAGGTLTFKNSHGDDYRLPVPNEEEYIVSLAEVGGGASE